MSAVLKPHAEAPGIEVTGRVPGQDTLLTPEALAFLTRLHRRFEPQRQLRLAARQTRQAEFDAGALPEDNKKAGEIAKTIVGALTAWDPIAKKPRWRVELQDVWNGGALTTAGDLVFQGTNRGMLNAYRADTDAAVALTLATFPDAGLDLPTQKLQAERQVPLMFSDLTDRNGFGSWTDEAVAANIETLALLGRDVMPDLWDRSILDEVHGR